MAASSLPPAGRMRAFQPFPLFGFLLALLVSIPVLTVLRSLALPTEGLWTELALLTLPRYLLNTDGLLVGVGAGVLVVGVGVAWLVTVCRFPGSR
ncbi:MAG: iron ABC transporter permease, partial [Chloroflexota bacterium]